MVADSVVFRNTTTACVVETSSMEVKGGCLKTLLKKLKGVVVAPGMFGTS